MNSAQKKMMQERLEYLKREKKIETRIWVALAVIGTFTSIILLVISLAVGLWRAYSFGKEISEIEFKLAGSKSCEKK